MAITEDLLTQLEETLRIATNEGHIIGHFGAFTIEGRHRAWWSIRGNEAVTKLVNNPDYKVAQILSVLGSEMRLAILRHLLDGPRTAADLVAALGMKTTGQAYHHLRELERGGYVKQREGGRYYFDLKVGRIYLAALALAADAGAEEPEEIPDC